MSAIDDWQNDAEESVNKLESTVKNLVEETDKILKRQLLKEANQALSEANDNIDTFGIQIRKVTSVDQYKYLDKKNQLSERVKSAKTDIKKQTQIVERSALMEGNSIEGEQGGDLLINHALKVQDKTREALQNTMLVMNETKNIAVNAAEQLNAQTDQIGKMGTNLKAIDEELMTSDKLLKDFAVRMMTDKLIMFFVAIIVIGVIAAVIVYVIFRDSDEPTLPPAPPSTIYNHLNQIRNLRPN